MRSFAVAALVATLAVPACGGDGVQRPPGSGELEVRLETPHQDDGALLVAVTGGPIDSATGATGVTVRLRRGADGATLLVTGAIAAGPLLTLHLPQADRDADYAATVLQAAALRSYELRDTSGYHLLLR